MTRRARFASRRGSGLRWQGTDGSTSCGLRAPAVRARGALVTAVSLVIMAGSGLRIFLAFPSFGAKVPQQDLLASAGRDHARRMARRRAAVALHVHVAVRRRGAASTWSGRSPAAATGWCCSRRATSPRRVADGAPLLPARSEAGRRPAVQPAPEARLHDDAALRRAVAGQRRRALQVGAAARAW